MNKMTPLVLSVLLLTGCKTFTGSFSVEKPIKLSIDEEANNCEYWDVDCVPRPIKKSLSVSPGRYGASLKIKSKKSIVLEFKNSRGKKIQANFKVPKNTDIPTSYGDFSIPARKTGQAYNIDGNVDTEVTLSETYHGWESCTYTRERRVCPRKRKKKKKCYWETETVYGEREVEYHYRTEDTDMDVNMRSPQSGKLMAKFNGSHHSSTKEYEYQGSCR